MEYKNITEDSLLSDETLKQYNKLEKEDISIYDVCKLLNNNILEKKYYIKDRCCPICDGKLDIIDFKEECSHKSKKNIKEIECICEKCSNTTRLFFKDNNLYRKETFLDNLTISKKDELQYKKKEKYEKKYSEFNALDTWFYLSTLLLIFDAFLSFCFFFLNKYLFEKYFMYIYITIPIIIIGALLYSFIKEEILSIGRYKELNLNKIQIFYFSRKNYIVDNVYIERNLNDNDKPILNSDISSKNKELRKLKIYSILKFYTENKIRKINNELIELIKLKKDEINNIGEIKYKRIEELEELKSYYNSQIDITIGQIEYWNDIIIKSDSLNLTEKDYEEKIKNLLIKENYSKYKSKILDKTQD